MLTGLVLNLISFIVLAIFFGAALGNVIRGVPLNAEGYFFEPLFTHWGTSIGVSARVSDLSIDLDDNRLQLAKTFLKRYTLTAKYADYRAETFAKDTQKVWLMAEATF